MGGLTGPRNNLLCLFPHCFSRRCRVRRFRRVLPDLMQDLVAKVRFDPSPTLDVPDVVRHLLGVVYGYMQSPEYEISEALIVLLDSPEYVPTIKARTQRKRDAGANEAPPIMTPEVFARYATRSCNHLIVQEDSRLEIDRLMLYRSMNTRLQLTRALSNGMARMPVPQGLVLWLDDAFAIQEDVYCERRAQMLEDYDFLARAPYDQECLVTHLSRHHMTLRLLVYPDGEYKTLDEKMQMGEADIKICHYITRACNSYLVVSQDTDVIFILLLHCKRLLNELGRLPDDLELWIDTQTPSDRRDGVERPYRFIDVKALYNGILELFAREYPGVQNPVETLVFLSTVVQTDFTKPFHKSLGITERVVWDTFSELHCARPRDGFIKYSDECSDDASRPPTGPVKRERTAYLPRELHGVLNKAVQCAYDTHRDSYDLALDELVVQRFLYLLCELRVRQDLCAIGYSQYDNKLDNRYIVDTDQLFAKIALLEEHIEACRTGADPAQLRYARESERDRAFRAALDETKAAVAQFKELPVKEQWATPALARSQVDLLDMDAIPMPGSGRKRAQSAPPALQKPPASAYAKAADLARKERPPQYGVPPLQRMLAHIYRHAFVLNYYQNGWLAPEHALSYGDPHERQPALSKHGWRLREVPQTAEAIARGDFNSPYFATRHCAGPPQPGVIPFRLYETEECDDVYNRRHEHYALANTRARQ